MSYHRNGIERFCMRCGRHKPAKGFEKSSTGHEHLCLDCMEKQKAETSAREAARDGV